MIENCFFIIKNLSEEVSELEKASKLMFEKNSNYKCKAEKWWEKFANRMSQNLVRMNFALILCVASSPNKKKCLVTLFSDFTLFFQAWPI